MIRIRLTPEQREALEKARRIRTSPLAERCVFVLLSDRGQNVLDIAQSTGRHAHTIRSWLKSYRQGGIQGRKDTPPPGRANRKEQATLPLLERVIPQSPRDYGYLEEGWSTNVLVDYLRKQSLSVSASTVKRALKRGGWVYKRFAKTMPTHAPTAAEKKVGWTRSSEKSLPSRARMLWRSCLEMRRTSPMSRMCTEDGSGRRKRRKSRSLNSGKARQFLGRCICTVNASIGSRLHAGPPQPSLHSCINDTRIFQTSCSGVFWTIAAFIRAKK